MVKIDDNTFTFESMNDFVRTLKDTPRIKGRDKSSESKDSDFCGTDNIEEAYDLAQYGWDKGVVDIEREVNKTMFGLSKKPKQHLDVVGFAPNVPLYLNGVTTNMINKKQQTAIARVINVAVCVGAVWDKKASDLIKASSEIVAKLMEIEQEGTRINLYCVVGGGHWGEDENVGLIKLKTDRERFNYKKLIFPLAHPSMLRRLDFAFNEKLPKNDITSGYGHGRFWNDTDKAKKLLSKCLDKELYIISVDKAVEDLGEESSEWRTQFEKFTSK